MPAADFPALRAVKPVRPKPEAPVTISPLEVDLEQLLLRLEALPEAEQAWEIERWSEQQRQHFADLLPAWRSLLAHHIDQQVPLDAEADPDDPEPDDDMDDELQALLYPDQPDPALIAALYSQLTSLDFAEDDTHD